MIGHVEGPGGPDEPVGAGSGGPDGPAPDSDSDSASVDEPLVRLLRPSGDEVLPVPPGAFGRIRRGAARRRTVRALVGGGVAAAAAAAVLLPTVLTGGSAPVDPRPALVPPAVGGTSSPSPSPSSSSPPSPSPSRSSKRKETTGPRAPQHPPAERGGADTAPTTGVRESERAARDSAAARTDRDAPKTSVRDRAARRAAEESAAEHRPGREAAAR